MKPSFYTLFALFAAASAAASCSIEPWVKPYERNQLADPIMSFDRQPVLTGYRTHVHEVTEGARGATDVAGSGCGCN